MPIRVRKQGYGNENEIEYGEGEQGSFPRPITVHHHGQAQEHKRASDRRQTGHAKKSQARANGDTLGDQSQEIADAQVDHGEPTPERPKAFKDQFRVSAMRGGTETHGHFLYDDGHAKREDDEGDEEPNSKSRARRCVGNHTRAVILTQHDKNSRSDKQPQQAKPGEETSLGASREDTHAVMRTIYVLVGDNDVFLGDGLRRYPRQRS